MPPANLFPIRKTGVSTEPVRQAAKAFLVSLTPADRKKTLFGVDDLEWRKWDNRHRYVRQGKGFNTMTEGQRELAFNLLKASLSADGLKQTRDIMKLNGTLAELTQRFEEYGQWLYWITIMGEPSATKPWGWQLDGHHVVINYFVLGDQVVMSPVFMGSEPVKAEAVNSRERRCVRPSRTRGWRSSRCSMPNSGQRQSWVMPRAQLIISARRFATIRCSIIWAFAAMP